MSLEKNVAGKYEILDQELGKGAWSVVQKCRPIPPYFPSGFSSSTQFVVKIIAKSHLLKLAGPENEARAMNDVLREIDTLKNIPPHPSIVKFVEHFETQTHFLLIFEEVSGGDLCELILNLQGKIKLEDARRYLYQIILALLQCHSSNVAHRDVKPENLLVDEDNNIKLTDFGLAKRVKDAPCAAIDPLSPEELARPGAWLAKKICVCTDIIGTPRYGAPEMFAAKFSKQTYDAYLADTWSVGIVGYILLTGSFPFSVRDKQNPTERDTYNAIVETNPVYPPGPDLGVHLVKQLLQKDPSKRIRLHEAIDHPWFEGLWQDSSVVVQAVRSQPLEGLTRSGQDQLLRDFEEEARALRLALRRLRGDVIRRRENAPTASSATVAKRATSASRPSSLVSGVRPSTPAGRSLQSPMPSPARAPLVGSSTPTGTRARSPAVGVSSRADSKDSGITGRRSGTPLGVPSVRGASPLARSNPVAVRRGTPARPLTGAAAPSPTRPSVGTPTPSSLRSSTPVGLGIARGGVASARAPTPTGRSTPISSSLGMPRAPTPTRPKTSIAPKSVAPSPKPSSLVPSARSVGGSQGAGFANGEHVLYNGHRAVVHFSGITTFGPGSWLGIEMLDADGTNDGTSHVDKKRYFTCPKGKGVFVRPQQVVRVSQ